MTCRNRREKVDPEHFPWGGEPVPTACNGVAARKRAPGWRAEARTSFAQALPSRSAGFTTAFQVAAGRRAIWRRQCLHVYTEE